MNQVLEEMVWKSSVKGSSDRMVLLFIARNSSAGNPVCDLSSFGLVEVARQVGFQRWALDSTLKRLKAQDLLTEHAQLRFSINVEVLKTFMGVPVKSRTRVPAWEKPLNPRPLKREKLEPVTRADGGPVIHVVPGARMVEMWEDEPLYRVEKVGA